MRSLKYFNPFKETNFLFSFLFRKLKNRVAAQTARDRKKMRMDQLEAQLAELTEHVKELTDLTAVLTEQNSELSESNEELQAMLTRCTCGSSSHMEESDSSSRTRQGEVLEGVVIPVSTQIVGSAVSHPQQRAISVLAVIRIMVLSALCQHWVSTAVSALPLLALNSNLHSIHSGRSKNHIQDKWWGPQQQSWNPVGT